MGPCAGVKHDTGLHSQEISDREGKIIFVNLAGVDVDIYWIDGSGNEQAQGHIPGDAGGVGGRSAWNSHDGHAFRVRVADEGRAHHGYLLAELVFGGEDAHYYVGDCLSADEFHASAGDTLDVAVVDRHSEVLPFWLAFSTTAEPRVRDATVLHCPSPFCRTLFQIERAALHSYGPESHSC